ncbi:MAG TPA: hypothetical protein VMC07_03130 [Candidatus Omnitrophota bacterium]|nr:hypothetical protein [Candidatus Omnitrophota bacterium]
MATGLTDKLKEHFPKIFGEKKSLKIEIGEGSIAIEETRGISAYPFKVVGDVLVIGGPVGIGMGDNNFVKNILRLTEAAAREAGFSQINYDADDSEDRQTASIEGYTFGEQSYVGVKRLK